MSAQKHYNMRIEPITYIESNNLTFSEGNVVKYISRHRKKDGANDIKKAIDYCQRILLHEYGISSTFDCNEQE